MNMVLNRFSISGSHTNGAGADAEISMATMKSSTLNTLCLRDKITYLHKATKQVSCDIGCTKE